MSNSRRWWPALALALGCAFLLLSGRQRPVSLTLPLAELPRVLLGITGRDTPISLEEQRVAGMSNYLLRNFTDSARSMAFQIYVGYYADQSQGKSIHSPKNCLPGAGWEPLSAGTVSLSTAAGAPQVNRYVVGKGNSMAVVYYWYQGRGRIRASEYAVKWDLLRDKALRGRSEEALVRVVVPIAANNIPAADSVAGAIAGKLADEVEKHLPTYPGRSRSRG